MEARTNFEKRQSMRTGKREDSSELFGGRVEGGGGVSIVVVEWGEPH